jgi:hypothetical protein
MILTPKISVSINTSNGDIELVVKDDTTWPVDGNARTSYFIGFYAYKVSVLNTLNSTTVTSNPLALSSLNGNIFENDVDSKAGVRFKVGEDGLHKIYMVPFTKVPTNINGDFYYDGTNILYREDNVYSIKTFQELLSEGVISDDYLTNFPVNPRISIELDRIAEKYSKGRSGSSDSDYKKWITLYIQLYGALLSFDKGAHLDYERKVRAANSLF